MTSRGGYEQILAVSRRDARIYRLSERLAMIFGVMTLLIVLADVAVLFKGSLKVPLRQLLILEIPFPVAFVLSVWIHRHVARKHGLL